MKSYPGGAHVAAADMSARAEQRVALGVGADEALVGGGVAGVGRRRIGGRRRRGGRCLLALAHGRSLTA